MAPDRSPGEVAAHIEDGDDQHQEAGSSGIALTERPMIAAKPSSDTQAAPKTVSAALSSGRRRGTIVKKATTARASEDDRDQHRPRPPKWAAIATPVTPTNPNRATAQNPATQCRIELGEGDDHQERR